VLGREWTGVRVGSMSWGEEFGGDGLAAGLRADEIEDGVAVEGGVLRGTQGTEGPVQDVVPLSVVAGWSEAEKVAEGFERLVRISFGFDGSRDDFREGVVEEGLFGGLEGPGVCGDGGVLAAVDVESQDVGGCGWNDGGASFFVDGGGVDGEIVLCDESAADSDIGADGIVAAG